MPSWQREYCALAYVSDAASLRRAVAGCEAQWAGQTRPVEGRWLRSAWRNTRRAYPWRNFARELGEVAKMPRFRAAMATFVGIVLLQGCGPPAGYQEVQGATMGTQYRVVAQCPQTLAAQDIYADLAAVDVAMSTYRSDSELVRLNGAVEISAGPEWFDVSAALFEVLRASLTIAEQSSGAFDPTVGGLVDVWGLGAIPPKDEISEEELKSVRQATGYQALKVRESAQGRGQVRFARPRQLDLSAIAKGFAVDQIAVRLMASRCDDFLIYVGGEVRAQGVRPDGTRWRVGIDDPKVQGRVLGRINLGDGAVATSGNYRNWREIDGDTVGHLLDPRTGRAISTTSPTSIVSSVTVIHPSAMWADGYATAFFVMGEAAALQLANALDLAVVMVVDQGDAHRIRLSDRAAALEIWEPP